MKDRFTNLQDVMDIIKDVAAQIIEPRFKRLSDGEINTKTGPSDLVTIADTEAEAALDRRLEALIPGSIGIGEEAISRGDKSLDDLAQDGTYWIIDPVDGTYNFANGVPKFGTMVALVHNGETVQSWIYDIPQKREVMAENGAGATLNGQKKTLPDNNEDLSAITGYISVRFAPKEIKKTVESLKGTLGSIDAHFCCAYEYTGMIAEEASYAVYTRTKPWDHLAGNLILEEAGGFVRKWDRTPFSARSYDKGMLAATDENLWDNVYDLVLKTYIKEKNI